MVWKVLEFIIGAVQMLQLVILPACMIAVAVAWRSYADRDFEGAPPTWELAVPFVVPLLLIGLAIPDPNAPGGTVWPEMAIPLVFIIGVVLSGWLVWRHRSRWAMAIPLFLIVGVLDIQAVVWGACFTRGACL